MPLWQILKIKHIRIAIELTFAALKHSLYQYYWTSSRDEGHQLVFYREDVKRHRHVVRSLLWATLLPGLFAVILSGLHFLAWKNSSSTAKGW